MMEITAKLGVVNEVSVSLEEDTPWEANEGNRVARNNEYSVNPASSLNSKGKVSIPLEGNNPWEIFDDTNMANKDETGADSAPDAESVFAFKDSSDTVPDNMEGRNSVVISKREESSSWPPNAWDRSALHIKTSTL